MGASLFLRVNRQTLQLIKLHLFKSDVHKSKGKNTSVHTAPSSIKHPILPCTASDVLVTTSFSQSDLLLQSRQHAFHNTCIYLLQSVMTGYDGQSHIPL